MLGSVEQVFMPLQSIVCSLVLSGAMCVFVVCVNWKSMGSMDNVEKVGWSYTDHAKEFGFYQEDSTELPKDC